MTQKSASFVGRGPRFNRICQGATEAWHSSWPAEMQPQSWQQKGGRGHLCQIFQNTCKKMKIPHVFAHVSTSESYLEEAPELGGYW